MYGITINSVRGPHGLFLVGSQTGFSSLAKIHEPWFFHVERLSITCMKKSKVKIYLKKRKIMGFIQLIVYALLGENIMVLDSRQFFDERFSQQAFFYTHEPAPYSEALSNASRGRQGLARLGKIQNQKYNNTPQTIRQQWTQTNI